MRRLLAAVACLMGCGSFAHAANPAEVTKAFIDGKGALHIVASGGRDFVVKPQEWQAGGRFEQVAIAQDHKTVGWLATQMLSPLEGGTNYSYAVALEVEVWRDGRIVRKFSAPAFSIQDWTFIDGSGKVAFHVAPPHGEDFDDCYLFDVSTGKRIAHWSRKASSSSMPGWARTLLRSELAPTPDIN